MKIEEPGYVIIMLIQKSTDILVFGTGSVKTCTYPPQHAHGDLLIGVALFCSGLRSQHGLRESCLDLCDQTLYRYIKAYTIHLFTPVQVGYMGHLLKIHEVLCIYAASCER